MAMRFVSMWRQAGGDIIGNHPSVRPEDIAALAYAKYLQRCQAGVHDPERDWLEAEAELLQRIGQLTPGNGIHSAQ
jgi:hypothetical protein